jgi:hypothetical protein
VTGFETELAAMLLRADTLQWPRYSEVTVPAAGRFSAAVLVEGKLSDGRTTGLCASLAEAQERAVALYCGAPQTQAPRGQASRREMLTAWANLQIGAIRDGGQCAAAVELALAAGLHSVEWAQASRYLCAGWVPCAPAR